MTSLPEASTETTTADSQDSSAVGVDRLCERCGDRLEASVSEEAPKNVHGGPLPWLRGLTWPICGGCEERLERDARAALAEVDAPGALRRGAGFIARALVSFVILDRLAGWLYILGSRRASAPAEVAAVRAVIYPILPGFLLFVLTLGGLAVNAQGLLDPNNNRRQFEEQARRDPAS